MGQVVGLDGGVVVADGEPVSGVVVMMRRLLAMAVSGNLRGVAVATVEAGGFVGMEWVGEPADRHLLAVGVADLQYAIFASRYERSTVADQPDAGDEPA